MGMHVMHLSERGRICDKQTNSLTVPEQGGLLQTLKTQNTLQQVATWAPHPLVIGVFNALLISSGWVT